jgi:hypothetical protein
VKKLLIGLLALVFLVGCAAPDRSTEIGRVAQFGWTQIRTVEEGSFTGVDTMEFDLRHYRGAVTLWFNPDTTAATSAANLPDTCSTISLELYNDDSAEWGKYYSGVTKLDTVDRAVMNIDFADADVYIPLAKFNADQFAWADRGRIIWDVGSAGSVAATKNIMQGEVWVGGQ